MTRSGRFAAQPETAAPDAEAELATTVVQAARQPITRPRRTQAERSGATTERLIAAGRRLFAERGFAHAAAEDIVAAAAVTRGALYHHFTGKEALFEAVFLQIQAEIGARIEAAALPKGDRLTQLLAGCRAFLQAACEPDVAQIVLQDGPAVLGPAAWRRADERHATVRLRRALAEIDEEAGGGTFDVAAATVLLNGALNEAALWIADAVDPASALSRAAETFERLASGIVAAR